VRVPVRKAPNTVWEMTDSASISLLVFASGAPVLKCFFEQKAAAPLPPRSADAQTFIAVA